MKTLPVLARAFGYIATALAACCALAQSPATSYPNRPIRIITPYTTGGTTGAVGNLIGARLTEAWGQQVVMDFRPGANTVIGTEAVARAAPDGYTLGLIASTHVINPHLIASLPYDSIKDFIPVAGLVSTGFVLAVHPSVPADNMQEFIALAKAKPGQLSYGTSGNGSPPHLAGALFAASAGIDIRAIPYKGAGPAVTDTLGGHIQGVFQNPGLIAPHHKAGKLKALAFSGESRTAALPQVPTFAEQGLPGFSAKTWFGLFAPAGTPRDIVAKLSAEVARILALPDIRDNLVSQGLDPFIVNTDQFAQVMRTDSAAYARVVKASNIKLDN